MRHVNYVANRGNRGEYPELRGCNVTGTGKRVGRASEPATKYGCLPKHLNNYITQRDIMVHGSLN
jgi:hypothetical protein